MNLKDGIGRNFKINTEIIKYGSFINVDNNRYIIDCYNINESR